MFPPGQCHTISLEMHYLTSYLKWCNIVTFDNLEEFSPT